MPSEERTAIYEVALTARFTFTIDDTIKGAPGLRREQVEELVEENWWWLSGSTNVLLESCWELESFAERPRTSQNG
jgi:hypothetical protein